MSIDEVKFNDYLGYGASTNNTTGIIGGYNPLIGFGSTAAQDQFMRTNFQEQKAKIDKAAKENRNSTLGIGATLLAVGTAIWYLSSPTRRAKAAEKLRAAWNAIKKFFGKGQNPTTPPTTTVPPVKPEVITPEVLPPVKPNVTRLGYNAATGEASSKVTSEGQKLLGYKPSIPNPNTTIVPGFIKPSDIKIGPAPYNKPQVAGLLPAQAASSTANAASTAAGTPNVIQLGYKPAATVKPSAAAAITDAEWLASVHGGSPYQYEGIATKTANAAASTVKPVTVTAPAVANAVPVKTNTGNYFIDSPEMEKMRAAWNKRVAQGTVNTASSASSAANATVNATSANTVPIKTNTGNYFIDNPEMEKMRAAWNKRVAQGTVNTASSASSAANATVNTPKAKAVSLFKGKLPDSRVELYDLAKNCGIDTGKLRLFEKDNFQAIPALKRTITRAAKKDPEIAKKVQAYVA